MAFTTHTGITRRFFFPNTPWTHQVNWRYAAKWSNGKPLPSLERTITEVGEKKQIKLTLQQAYLPVYDGFRQGITACVMNCHKCLIKNISIQTNNPEHCMICYAINTFERKNMKTWQKLTLHRLTVSRPSIQKGIVARKSNLIHRTFDLAPQVLDNRNIRRQ